MAKVYPELHIIKKFKQQPTEGELHLLVFLIENLSDDYEIFFNPYLNGDRPDIVVFRHGYGVLIFEVKDWDLSNYSVDNHKEWLFQEHHTLSPIKQVHKYKENLFDLHVEGLLECKILDIRRFSNVSCVVYFHKATEEQVNNLCGGNRFESDIKYCTWLKHNIDLWGNNSLTIEKLKGLLARRYMSKRTNFPLSNDIFNNIRSILEPSLHLKEQGKAINYTDQQLKIITSQVKEQRVNGVFGSGKTTVLAARAVKAYLRAIENKPHEEVKILILTYNITLANYLKDRLNDVAEDFYKSSFTIINYHQFINGVLNNVGIKVKVPEDLDSGKVSEYLELNYYSNIQLFQNHSKNISKYDAVLIDEIQDYRREWMEIIKTYIRDPEGDYVLFGDVKQNIYGLRTTNKDVTTNVIGRPITLNHSFRAFERVSDLAYAYQRVAFDQKYELDLKEDGSLPFINSEGFVKYHRLDLSISMNQVYIIIRDIISSEKVSRNDVVVLGTDNNWLCYFDAYYRYRSREKTSTTMETLEARYMHNLNLFGNGNEPRWLLNLLDHIAQKNMNKPWEKIRQSRKENYMVHVANLLSRVELDDLDSEYMNIVLEEICKKLNINRETFRDGYLAHYDKEILEFRQKVKEEDYTRIQRYKRFHFRPNPGFIKISTIHSFKGWESPTIIMLVTPDLPKDTLDELLYVGITRAKSNLHIYNFGNEFFEQRLKACRDQQGNLII